MTFDRVKRREFITLLGWAAAAPAIWPLAARAQQGARVLRVGFVGMQPPDAAIYVAFRKRMAELGYRDSEEIASSCQLRASICCRTRCFSAVFSAGGACGGARRRSSPSELNHTPHATAVYASCSASPPPHATLASRRLARPSLGRTYTG